MSRLVRDIAAAVACGLLLGGIAAAGLYLSVRL